MNEIKQRLQGSRNWLGLIEELEREADQLEDKKEKSQRLYKLGQACEELFLRKDKAMVSYQKAFKLFPQDTRPLERARLIYHEMGNQRMVAKLLEFQLKVVKDPVERMPLMLELGKLYVELERLDEAAAIVSELEARDPNDPELRRLQETLDFDDANWEEKVSTIIDQAQGSTVDDAVTLLIRGARIYGVMAREDETREALLRKALRIKREPRVERYLQLVERSVRPR